VYSNPFLTGEKKQTRETELLGWGKGKMKDWKRGIGDWVGPHKKNKTYGSKEKANGRDGMSSGENLLGEKQPEDGKIQR